MSRLFSALATACLLILASQAQMSLDAGAQSATPVWKSTPLQDSGRIAVSCGNSTPSSSCTQPLPQATTAHTYLFAVVSAFSTSSTAAPHIVSLFTCTNSRGCNSRNAIDSCALFSSQAALVNGYKALHSMNLADAIDMCWIPNGAGGATHYTVNLSSNGNQAAAEPWFTGLVEFQCKSGCNNVSTDLVYGGSTGAVVTRCGTCSLMSFSGLETSNELIVLGNGSCQDSTVSPSPWTKTESRSATAYFAANVNSTVPTPRTNQTAGCGTYDAVAVK